MARWQPGPGEWVLAVGVAALALADGVLGAGAGMTPAPLGHVLVVVGGLLLLGGRRAPVLVLALTAAALLGHRALGLEVPALAVVVAVHLAVRGGHRWPTAAVSVVLLGALPLSVLAADPDLAVPEALERAREVLGIAWLLAAAASGEAVRQAERRADEAERTREEVARRRADEERLRIARELHDTLTHQISVIAVQAEAAVHGARHRGEVVPDSLAAIREAGRDAARELRATLEALREDDLHPGPALADLPELVVRMRPTGVDASLSVDGAPRTVPAAVGRTVYRVVQESLTNVARHTTAGRATVRLDYGLGILTVSIDDDGPARTASEATAGIGILGMRERVSALGGRITTGPRRGGGFAVRAELPAEGP